MDTRYISVNRKKTRRIIELYTMQGLTQKEIGEMIFPLKMERTMSRELIVRKVLHQFGLGMQNRKNYKQAGLTQKIIDMILGNYLVVYPLMIPCNGEPNPILNFDLALEEYVSGDGGKKAFIVGVIQTIIGVVILLIMQILLTSHASGVVGYIIQGAPIFGYLFASFFFSSMEDSRLAKRGIVVDVITLVGLFILLVILPIVFE